MKLKNIRYFFEPRYGYAQGAKPRWVTTSPESIVGFENVFLTDDAIYGLVWGVEKSKMETCKPQLVRFDQNGNPVKSYTLDDTLESMAVDNDGTIYGVGYDSNGRYKLCRLLRKPIKNHYNNEFQTLLYSADSGFGPKSEDTGSPGVFLCELRKE